MKKNGQFEQPIEFHDRFYSVGPRAEQNKNDIIFGCRFSHIVD